MKKTLAFLLISGAALAAVGCGDEAEDDLNQTVDCAQICEKRDDCVGETDVSECTDYCQDRADNSATTADLIDKCNDCLDDTSCGEAAVQCFAACVLVPTTAGD